ncbi:MAG: biotin/lipoyl-containing protein [Acidimicrobiia bacterium]
MRHTVKVPKLGDTTSEVVLVKWHVEIDRRVELGDPLAAVETDKADVDIEVPVAGVLIEHLAEEGDELAVGAALAVIESQPKATED